MATYQELHQIIGFEVDGALDLYNKIAIAALVAAGTISSGSDTSDPPWDQTAGKHDQRVKWAELAYSGDVGVKNRLF